ncbi:NAD-dependent epimerase/dehydratase family protein [Streptomyces sp. NRAIS4]
MRGPAEGREQTGVVVGAGHRVVGLARSEDGAAALKSAPAEVHRCSLDEPDGLARAGAEAEGVIHLAALPGGTHARAAASPTRAPSRRWAPPSRAPAGPSWSRRAR